MFHSHIIYAIQVYSAASPSLLNQIILKQKAAIRTISNAKYNAHTAPLFKEKNILPFNQLVQYFKTQFMLQYRNKQLPRSFNNVWQWNYERGVHELRNNTNLYVPYFRLNSINRHPICSFPRIWNELDDWSIKSLWDKDEFRTKFKKWLLHNLPEIPCTIFACPSCPVDLSHLTPELFVNEALSTWNIPGFSVYFKYKHDATHSTRMRIFIILLPVQTGLSTLHILSDIKFWTIYQLYLLVTISSYFRFYLPFLGTLI